MTKEDIKNICQIYDNFRRERDAATVAYNSEDAFWAHVLTTYNFSRPSIPSNLDEAAKEYAKITSVKVWGEIDPKKDLKGYMQRANYSVGLLDGFKAGVEWMVQQGASYETVISADKTVPVLPMKDVSEMGFDYGDKVIVQIRKK